MTSSTDTPSIPEVATRLRSGLRLPEGFTFAASRCGIKQGRPDLGVIVAEPAATAAGAFTQNRVRAACVERDAELVPSDSVKAVLVNSGNANALTGPDGARVNDEIARELASVLEVEDAQVLTCSTGVIGVPLPADIVTRSLPALVAQRGEDPTDFAGAILTTDLCTKVAHVELKIPGFDAPIRMLGVAKGSGMIHPDMATTLAFVCTDAAVAPDVLQDALIASLEGTFNAISVDGDTSTNDTVIALAGGASGVRISGDAALSVFRAGLTAVLRSLADQVVRDGEGATRMLEAEVTGAPSRVAARCIARGIVSSSLVKCSVFAGQPDFGRIAMAVGQAAHEHDLHVDPTRMTIAAQGVELLTPDGPALTSSDVARRLRDPVVRWTVDLGQGDHSFVARGCDLSYDYVRINADESTQIEVSPGGAVRRNVSLGAYSPRLKHQLLVEGLGYVRSFTGLKLQVYVAPNVGGPDLAENLAKDLELCLDAGLRPLVIVPNEAAATRIHDHMNAAGHFSSAVVPDPMRIGQLLDRGHLCVLVRPSPDPAAVVDLAIKLGVQKLVTLTGEPGLRDAKGVVQRLSPEAFLMGLERGRFDATHADTLVLARHATTRGVAALHVLDARIPHAIVGELFTTEGIGSLITRQVVA